VAITELGLIELNSNPRAAHPPTHQRLPAPQRHANARPTPGPHPHRGQRPCASPPPSSLVGRTWARISPFPHSLPGAPCLLGFALSRHSAKKPCEYTQASSPGVAPRLSPHNQLWGAGTPRQPRTGVPQGGPPRQGGSLPSLPPRALLDPRPATLPSLATPFQPPALRAELSKVRGLMALYLATLITSALHLHIPGPGIHLRIICFCDKMSSNPKRRNTWQK